MRQRTTLKRKGFTALALASISLMLLLASPMASYALPQPPLKQNREQKRDHSQIRTETRLCKGRIAPVRKDLTININVNINAAGIAHKITNRSETEEAQVIFNASVMKSSMGRAKLAVTEGNLTIGDAVYEVEKGIGLIALHSDKIIVHMQIKDPNSGTKHHMTLNGKLINSLISPFDAGSSIDVSFTKPQSKIAGQYFLTLSGTLTRVN